MRRVSLSRVRPVQPVVDIAFSDAERLIGLGFRHWVAGYKSGDIDRWEQTWQLYSKALGTNAARTAVSELSAWVRAVSAAARREIEVRNSDCDGFCRDDDRGLPAQHLPGHARVRLRTDRKFSDRRSRASR